jgi:uncharacterized protein YuzE
MSDVALRITYSESGGALYLKLGEGDVAETVAVEELVYVDVDAEGRPRGVEFVVAADFLPFLARRGGEFVLPARMSSAAPAAR